MLIFIGGEGERGRRGEREGRKNKLFREGKETEKSRFLLAFIEERKAKIYPSFPLPFPFPLFFSNY
jgi:hypothetical protein